MPRFKLNKAEPIRSSSFFKGAREAADSGAIVKPRAKPRAVSQNVIMPMLVHEVMAVYCQKHSAAINATFRKIRGTPGT